MTSPKNIEIPPVKPGLTSGSPNDTRNILRSRLGRKIVFRFLFVGILPIIIFGVPLYLQTSDILNADARATLESYAKLAKGQIFTTLERAATRLDRLTSARTPPSQFDAVADSLPFRRLIVLNEDFIPASGEFAPWPPLDDGRIAFLKEGRVVITRPYPLEEGATVALLIRRPAGGYLAGEMDPVELWNVTRASNFGPRDSLFVLDENGRALVASQPEISGFQQVMTSLPDASRASGDSNLMGHGEVLWGFTDLWLRGALGGERWGIVAARNKEVVAELPRTLFRSLVILMMIAFCVIIILSFREARTLLAPIVDMANATREVANGNWKQNLGKVTDDELGDLAQSFNDMTRRLKETYEESLRLTREAMVGRLAAMVAHQINNPLAAIKCKLGILEAGFPERASHLRVVLDQVDRIARTVKELLGFAKMRTLPGSEVVMTRIVRNVEGLFRDSFESQGIELIVDVPDAPYTVSCDADDFQELLVNFLENAREACLHDEVADGQHENVAAEKKHRVSMMVALMGDQADIVIEDDGPGFGGNLDHVFEPFFSTKTFGTGLGLAICSRICETAGGRLWAEERKEGGARFIARLPVRILPA